MDIFDIDPNALIILVIMIIGGLKWFLERMKSEREGEDQEGPTTFEDLYEEARREIQERQNRQYPSEAEAREKLEEFERPVIFETAAAPAQKPPPLPARQPKRPTKPKPAYDPSAPPPPVRPTLSSAERAALARIQTEGMAGRRRRRRSAAQSQVRRLLASPASARDAIVLREILGPPKGSV